MRLIRLILGVMIIVQGFQTHQWAMLVLGVLFSLIPLLNIGCSSNNNCKTRMPSKNNHKPTEDIQYEEIS